MIIIISIRLNCSTHIYFTTGNAHITPNIHEGIPYKAYPMISGL